MPVSVAVISLGCSKNQVDAEAMLYQLHKAGYEIKDDPAHAACVIINTCGFLESARSEAIESILEMGKLKPEGTVQKILVTGCMAQSLGEEILKEMPEVDFVCGLSGDNDIVSVVERVMANERAAFVEEPEKLDLSMPRILGNEPYFAYLKIADGCDNRCAYCRIPYIRGAFRSRTVESIVAEAEDLAKKGVVELNVVAQDVTRYGEDLYGEKKLPDLLRRLCQIDGIRWVRVLYGYPERVTDDLLHVMAEEDKIVKYIDLPLQHCDGEVLKTMNRAGDEKTLRTLIARMREKVPGLTLRTTLITGFPGETKAQFASLVQFVKDVQFDRLGVFPYSREEGTPAYDMPGQVSEKVKNRRAEIVMEEQAVIMERLNEKKIGSTQEVLTEGWDGYVKLCFGRTRADAPEVDGKIFFTPKGKRPIPGDIVQVTVTDVLEYDLLGEQV